MNNLKNLGLGLVLLAQASFCMTARASDYSFERDQCKATVQAIAKGLAIGAQGKVGVITVDSLTDTREYSVNITDPSGDPAWVDYRISLDNDEPCLVLSVKTTQTGG